MALFNIWNIIYMIFHMSMCVFVSWESLGDLLSALLKRWVRGQGKYRADKISVIGEQTKTAFDLVRLANYCSDSPDIGEKNAKYGK